MLLDMKSTSMAYVVFESENAKSAAVDAVRHGGRVGTVGHGGGR